MERIPNEAKRRVKLIIAGTLFVNSLPFFAWFLLSLGIGGLLSRIVLAIYSLPAGIVEELLDFTGSPFVWLVWTIPFWTGVVICIERCVFRWKRGPVVSGIID